MVALPVCVEIVCNRCDQSKAQVVKKEDADMLKRLMSVVAVVSTLMAVASCGSQSTPNTVGTVGTVAPVNGTCPNSNPMMMGNQMCAAYSQSTYCSGFPGTQVSSYGGYGAYCAGSGTMPSNYSSYGYCGQTYGASTGYGCYPSNSLTGGYGYGGYTGNFGSYVNYGNGSLSSLNPYSMYSSGSSQYGHGCFYQGMQLYCY
jgi:hypothetical protein